MRAPEARHSLAQHGAPAFGAECWVRHPQEFSGAPLGAAYAARSVQGFFVPVFSYGREPPLRTHPKIAAPEFGRATENLGAPFWPSFGQGGAFIANRRDTVHHGAHGETLGKKASVFTIHDSRFTIHDSPFTIHDSRPHGSKRSTPRCTKPVQRSCTFVTGSDVFLHDLACAACLG